MAIAATMEEKVDRQPPYAHKITAPEAPRRYRTAKVVALILTVSIFVCIKQLRDYPRLASNKDHTRQHKHFSPYQYDNEFFSSAQDFDRSPGQSALQDPKCDYTDSVMHIATELNVTDEFHFLDSSPVQDAQGLVIVQRGSSTQVSDIEIRISIAYSAPRLPDVSYGFVSANTLQLTYISFECVQVNVEISLRPDVRKGVRDFSVTTNMLLLRISSRLSWTVDNLSLHSAHGDTEFWGVWSYEPIITHNVSASSVTGEIWGYFVADAYLHLRSEAGTIDVLLVPRTNSDVPIALQSILVSTDSGRIDFKIWMEQPEVWPMEPFTHTTQIRSETGPIYGSVPLGTLTNYTSETGNIAAIMVPFGAASEDASKDIRTESKQGSVYVHVVNTIWYSLKNRRFDPLLNLRSRHKVNNGTLTVRYSSGWRGELEGLVSKGTLEFDGSRLKDVKKGENWVKATVGEGMSFMESWVNDGNLDIKMGLGPW